ncbi:MAG: MFS transporter [Ardenticatenaceae bacterium]|nr:MFS transporter [Ardenticatenaceae bacterium]
MNTNQHARKTVLVIFFINGLLLSSWVPHIPLVQERLALGEGVLGLALLAMAGGAIVAMPLSGVWSQRYGSGRVTTVAAFAFCAALPLPVLAPNLVSLIAALFVFGACNGAMDVAMNDQAVAVEKRYRRPIMSAFHGFFSLGGLVGSGLGGLALANQFPSISHVLLVSVLMVLGVIWARRFFLPPEADSTKQASKFVLPRGPLIGLSALAFLVLIAEGSMADWSAVYLRRVLGTGPGLAAAGYAAFSLMMAVGRLTGDRFVAGIGPVTLTRFTSLLAAVGLGGALLIHHPVAAVIGFACVGLGLSNLIPVLFSAAGRTPGVPSSTGIAAVATAGYFGFLAGPPLIGFVAEFSNLSVGLGVVAAAVLMVSFFATLTKPKVPAAEKLGLDYSSH